MGAVADVQVNYLVDEKALKTGAVSGTVLTFDLWSDAGRSTAVTSVPVTIDDIDLAEKLRRFVPKHGAKAPNTDRLIETLTGVAPPTALFLSVTGPGITPVGGSCQLQYASAAGAMLPCASQVGTEVHFAGCNVNVQNGLGDTTAQNGLGNLIVGYNNSFGAEVRSGSHNVVIALTVSIRATVASLRVRRNTVSGPSASVVGGSGNVASGNDDAAVNGGFTNTASGCNSSVSGGAYNTASNFYASVSSGGNNTASGFGASVSGGNSGTASGDFATVSGGAANVANAIQTSVSGGAYNTASNNSASVSGGTVNTASGVESSVSGGDFNHASGDFATVSGNSATGRWRIRRRIRPHLDFCGLRSA